jgi:hypothetical protein
MQTGSPKRYSVQSVALLRDFAYLARVVGKVLLTFYLPLMALTTLAHFPYDTDPPAGGSRA